MTGPNAAAHNAVLANTFCLVGTNAPFYETQVNDDVGGFTLPGTYTIDGVSCKVNVYGYFALQTSFNCGWKWGPKPPDIYFTWSYRPASSSSPGDWEFLLDWSYGASYPAGPEDAFCVLQSAGTITASSGGNVSSDYVSYVPASLSFSAGSCGGTVDSSFYFKSPNAIWTAIAFAGVGNVDSKFSKASATIAGYTGYRPTVTANRAGVVHMTCDNVYYDYWWRVFRGSTTVIEYGSDSTGDDGGNTRSITNTFTVSAGDVITLGDPSDYNVLTNVAIWWTAT
jgi:hypothetical protein